MTARIHVLKLELWIGTFGLGGIFIRNHTHFTFSTVLLHFWATLTEPRFLVNRSLQI